jgi:hypothetical protein
MGLYILFTIVSIAIASSSGWYMIVHINSSS